MTIKQIFILTCWRNHDSFQSIIDKGSFYKLTITLGEIVLAVQGVK